MPLLLIAGTFRPGTGVPDGDTVRFEPDNPDLLYRLARQGRPPNLNQGNGTVPVRYEGIDAMERGARLPESAEATGNNLRYLGLDGPEAVGRGFLLSRLIDTNGRPICFAYPGSAIGADGSEVFIDVATLRNSVNYRLLANGDAYPLFYDTLFQDLRDALAAVTEATRAAGRGVWANDATTTGALWAGRPSLATMAPIFPKLWRRLAHLYRISAFFSYEHVVSH